MKSLMRFEVRRNKRKGRKRKTKSGKNNQGHELVKKKEVQGGRQQQETDLLI
jgi:hypothetical protein